MSLHFSVYQENTCHSQSAPPACKQPTVEEEQTKAEESVVYWIVVTISIASVPLVNLILFFFQPSSLISSTGLSKHQITGLGTIQDYHLFYISMGLYGYILASLIFVTYQFKTIAKSFRQMFLFDHLFIAMLATDITYIGLHTLTFCTVYNSNQQTYILQPYISYAVGNILVIVMYCLTNLVVTGAIRIIILSVNWKNWQIVTLKLLMGGTSLLYFILGLMYLFGKDPMDKAIEQFVKQYQQDIIDLFANKNSTEFSYIPYFMNYNISLKEQALIVDNFTIST